MTRVVAGLIQCDGHFLICQRQAGHWHGLKWEFPGGKGGEGEQPDEALARELKEELGSWRQSARWSCDTLINTPGVPD